MTLAKYKSSVLKAIQTTEENPLSTYTPQVVKAVAPTFNGNYDPSYDVAFDIPQITPVQTQPVQQEVRPMTFVSPTETDFTGGFTNPVKPIEPIQNIAPQPLKQPINDFTPIPTQEITPQVAKPVETVQNQPFYQSGENYFKPRVNEVTGAIDTVDEATYLLERNLNTLGTLPNKIAQFLGATGLKKDQTPTTNTEDQLAKLKALGINTDDLPEDYKKSLVETTNLPQTEKFWRDVITYEFVKDRALDIETKYDGKIDDFTKLAGDVSTGVLDMLPQTAMAYFSGGTSAMAYVFADSSSRATKNAIQLGADVDQAKTYGLLMGAIETGTEMLAGGWAGVPAGKFTGLAKEGLLGTFEKATLKLAKTDLGQKVIKLAYQYLGEGAEEYLSEILGNYANAVIGQEVKGLGEVQEDALYAGLVGTLSAVVGDLQRVASVKVSQKFAQDNVKTVEEMPKEEQLSYVNELMSKTGTKVIVADTYNGQDISNSSGAYDPQTKTVIIPTKAYENENILTLSAVHEFTHTLETSGEYQGIQDSIIDFMKKNGTYAPKVADIVNRYGTKVDVNSEIVADFLQDTMFKRVSKTADGFETSTDALVLNSFLKNTKGKNILQKAFGAFLNSHYAGELTTKYDDLMKQYKQAQKDGNIDLVQSLEPQLAQVFGQLNLTDKAQYFKSLELAFNSAIDYVGEVAPKEDLQMAKEKTVEEKAISIINNRVKKMPDTRPILKKVYLDPETKTMNWTDSFTAIRLNDDIKSLEHTTPKENYPSLEKLFNNFLGKGVKEVKGVNMEKLAQIVDEPETITGLWEDMIDMKIIDLNELKPEERALLDNGNEKEIAKLKRKVIVNRLNDNDKGKMVIVKIGEATADGRRIKEVLDIIGNSGQLQILDGYNPIYIKSKVGDALVMPIRTYEETPLLKSIADLKRKYFDITTEPYKEKGQPVITQTKKPFQEFVKPTEKIEEIKKEVLARITPVQEPAKAQVIEPKIEQPKPTVEVAQEPITEPIPIIEPVIEPTPVVETKPIVKQPKQPTNDETKTRSFQTTAVESGVLNEEQTSDINKQIEDGKFEYVVSGDKQALAHAEGKIFAGADKAYNEFTSAYDSGRNMTKNDIAVAEGLIKYYADQKQNTKVNELIGMVAELGTSLGQQVQALSLIKKMSPAGQAMVLDKTFARLEEQYRGTKLEQKTDYSIQETSNVNPVELKQAIKEFSTEKDNIENWSEEGDLVAQVNKTQKALNNLAKKRGVDLEAVKVDVETLKNDPSVETLKVVQKEAKKQLDKIIKSLTKSQKTYEGKNIDLAIDPTLRDALINAKTQEEIDTAVENIKVDVASRLPATLGDKIQAWRYLSMLGNPKTHIRNIVSNATFGIVSRAKDTIGVSLEQLLPQEDRTKSLKVSKGIKNFASDIFKQRVNDLTASGKYDITKDIESRKKIFDTKILENARTGNMNLLENEDIYAMGKAFTNVLGQFMTARGYDPKTITDAQLEKAIIYATEQAKIRTFRQNSNVATWLNQIEKQNAATKVLVGSLIPFKKTPINILKTGFEYSPAGLIANIPYGISQVKKGNWTQAQFLDKMAAGLTGSALAGLGALMFSSGYLSIGTDDDKSKKENTFNSNLGGQNYSLKLGDWSVSLDWLSPAIMPLMVGAELSKMTEQKTGKNMLDASGESLANIFNPAFDLTMLQGVSDAFKSFETSGSDQMGNILTTMAANYATQFVPTALSQAAKIVDPNVRTTYAGSGLSGTLETTLNKIKNKIPFASMTNEPVINIKGEEVKQSGDVWLRAIQNLINPANIKENITDETDKEILRVFEETGNTSVIPSTAPSSFTYDGEKVSVEDADKTQYSKTLGNTSYNTLKEVFNDDLYKNLSNDQKADVISGAIEYASSIAKAELLGSKYINTSLQKMSEAEDNGVSISQYLIMNSKLDTIQSTEDFTRKEQFIADLVYAGYSDDEIYRYLVYVGDYSYTKSDQKYIDILRSVE